MWSLFRQSDAALTGRGTWHGGPDEGWFSLALEKNIGAKTARVQERVTRIWSTGVVKRTGKRRRLPKMKGRRRLKDCVGKGGSVKGTKAGGSGVGGLGGIRLGARGIPECGAEGERGGSGRVRTEENECGQRTPRIAIIPG